MPPPSATARRQVGLATPQVRTESSADPGAGDSPPCSPAQRRQATILCRLGASTAELAEALGISRRTLRSWMARDAAFAGAVKRGRDDADRAVADSLFHRALGFRHVAVKMFHHAGRVVVKRYVEHYPPDTAACVFWLRNRRPDLWREVVRSEALDKSGSAPPAPIDDFELARRLAFLLASADGSEPR